MDAQLLSMKRDEPQPFEIADRAEERLQRAYNDIEALTLRVDLLMQTVTLLASLCNKKLNSPKPQ